MCTIPPEEWSTEWGKKLHTKLMAIFLSNVNRFLRLIHRARFSSKFEVNWLLRMPPHFENRLGFDRSTAMIYGRKFDVQFFLAHSVYLSLYLSYKTWKRHGLIEH